MSTSTRPRSFLDLPVEVRLNVYEQLFRMTTVNIHNSAAKGSGCCKIPKRRDCVSLLTSAKLIAQEATPVFFKETHCFVKQCNCWYPRRERHFEMPFVNKLSIDGFDWRNHNGKRLGFYNVIGAIVNQLNMNHTMDFFACEPSFWEDEVWESNGTYRDYLDVCIEKGSQLVRDMEIWIRMQENGEIFKVKMLDYERAEVIYRSSIHPETRYVVDKFFKKHDINFSNLMVIYAEETEKV